MIVNKLYIVYLLSFSQQTFRNIGSSNESITLQTPHIVYHTPYKISDNKALTITIKIIVQYLDFF